MDSTFIERENSFTAEIKEIPNVLGAANSGRLPGAELGRAFNVRRADAPSETHFTVRNNTISKDFIDLYQMKLLAGRNFVSTDYNPDWGQTA
jgi:putative ABC transport system permease protein